MYRKGTTTTSQRDSVETMTGFHTVVHYLEPNSSPVILLDATRLQGSWASDSKCDGQTHVA